jgi:hypothetical protein
MIESRGVANTRRHILQIPQITQSLKNRGSAVGRRLASDRVNTIVLDIALRSIRRDQPSRHTATKTVKFERVGGTVVGGLGVSLIIRTNGQRWSNVVEETARLVIGQEEESLFPLGTGAESVVDLLDEDLAEGDVAGRVHGVGV